MSKELDAMEFICKILQEKCMVDIKWLFKNEYNTIIQALQELQAIKNSNPSEAMKILETLADDGLLNKEIGAISYNQIWLKRQIEVLKQALLKAQEQEKVIKLIFEKMVNILLLELAENVDEYNERIVRNGQLTEEEFNLLKRYF